MFKGKKLTVYLLTAAMAMGALAGCGKSDDGRETSGSGQSTAAPKTTQGTQAEGTTEGHKSDGERGHLTIALPQNSNVENYDTNYFTNLVENELNMDLEFVYLPSSGSDAKTKFSIMVSSQSELPDVVLNPGFSSLEIADYGSKGVFLPLNDYIANSRYFKEEVTAEDKEAILQATTSPDGNIYGLAGFAIEPANLVPFKMWINTTWLKNVGMDMPATTEEYYQVLKAFVEKDANGNGVQDEIGITGCKNGWGCNPAIYLMNSFVFYNGNQLNGGLSLAEDKTTVVAPFVTEGWKEGLEYMYRLCSEGLLSPAVFTQDDKQFTALISNEEPIVGSCAAGGYGYWAGSSENPNFQEMTMLAPLEGPSGAAYAAFAEYTPNIRYMITKDCKDPELAFALGDLFYRHDVSLTSRYGEEGVDWTEDPEICKNYKGLFEESEGIPCQIVQLQIQWSKVQNKHWYDAPPTYRNLETYKGIDGEYPEDTGKRNFRVEYTNGAVEHYYNAHPAKTLPSLIYTTEEADKIAEIQENIKSYVDESLAEFVTGNRPLSDWDNYLKELNTIGLDDWLVIAQTAYDRMTK